MADDLEALANSKFVDEEYEESINLYSKAISLQPNARLYSARSLAHMQLENYKDAIEDATKAISIDPNHSKAYLRKGVALFHLGDYQAAKANFITGSSIDSKNSSFKAWIKKCQSNIKDVECENKENEETDSSSPLVNGSNVSENFSLKNLELNSQVSSQPSPSLPSPQPSSQPSPPPSSIAASQPKFRHEWYQTPAHVVVTVFAKNIRTENIQILFGDQILSVDIKQAGSEFSMFTRLFDKILPESCKFSVMSTKIEIRLIKSNQVQWATLEYNENQNQNQIVKNKNMLATSNVNDAKPVLYPSSKKTVDWDKLEAAVKKEEKEEKLEGDAALNKLFQDIYASADEETRRAMNKSFVESKGSVLSTNWKDVGEKKVDPYK